MDMDEYCKMFLISFNAGIVGGLTVLLVSLFIAKDYQTGCLILIVTVILIPILFFFGKRVIDYIESIEE